MSGMNLVIFMLCSEILIDMPLFNPDRSDGGMVGHDSNLLSFKSDKYNPVRSAPGRTLACTE